MINMQAARAQATLQVCACDVCGPLCGLPQGRKTVQTTVAEASATGTQSLERAITLPEELASYGSRGARLTDLVSATGFRKGTVRRLLSTLIRQGMVDHRETFRRYFLGSQLFFLGRIAASRISL